MTQAEAQSTAATPRASQLESRAMAVLLTLCVAAVYAPVLGALGRQWWSDADYSHGFLVPFCSAWLLWQRREELAALESRPAASGLIILLGSLATLFVGTLGAELFLQRLSLVGVIAGLTIWLFGWRMAREASFSLALLLLAIPLPRVIHYQLVFPLQMLATRLATALLHLMNLFPVLREGNILILPSTKLEVAEACSGLRSVFSLLTIAALYAYLAEKNNWKRWALCMLVLPIAVVGNAGRVVFAAISAELAGVSAAEGWAHFLSGLFLFFFSTLLLLLSHAAMNEAPRWLARLRRPQ